MTRVVFGCVPDTDDDVTRGLLQKLCSILGAAVGLSVEPRVAASPQALAEELAAGQVDVAWTSPTLLTSNELRAATPLVCSVRGGMTLYHGVVFVRESSPYKSTVDLKGAHAAWVSETSASGYIFARLALASYGLDPRSLFGSETFHGSHGNVARAVLTGQADAGGVYAMFQDGNPMRPLVRAPFMDAVKGERGRILFATPAIPADLIVARAGLDPKTKTDLADILGQLHHNRDAVEPLQRVLGADGFAPFDPRSLEPLREQVQSGRELGLI